MRVWKASGADPRCTQSFTRATAAPLYAAFHTPCFTRRRRLRPQSTPYFIPLATRTNGASAFPDEWRWNPPPPSALAVHVAVLSAPMNRHRHKEAMGVIRQLDVKQPNCQRARDLSRCSVKAAPEESFREPHPAVISAPTGPISSWVIIPTACSIALRSASPNEKNLLVASARRVIKVGLKIITRDR